MRLRKVSRTRQGVTSQGGRGALLENMINYTNQLYTVHKVAQIQKIPTPITPISMQGAVITKAFFAEKSTVDYVGVWQGNAICFDAKECHTKTFPLKNVHDHQIIYMNEFEECGGIAFLIIYYTEFDKIYFMSIGELNTFVERMKNGGRKSISFDELDPSHFIDTEGSSVPIPYIEYIEKHRKDSR